MIGIGSAFVDYFFDVDESFLQRVHLSPEDSRAITPQEFTTTFSELPVLAKSPGGSTLITLATLASLSIPVGYAGITGDDTDGLFWETNLSSVSLQLQKKGETARSACLLSNNRENRSFLYTQDKKENDFFDDVDFDILNNCKLLHITPFYNDTEVTLEKLIKLTDHIEKPKISFNPALVYSMLGLKKLAPILKRTEIIFFSKEELSLLFTDIKKGSKELVTYGPKIVVCTLGEKGALITSRDKQILVATKPVTNIIDTTGAGDAFAAGFLSGILQNKSLEESANIANKIAGKSITNFGLNWIYSK